MINNTQKFLVGVGLQKFQGLDAEGFNLKLDNLTRQLMKQFPATARKNWGAARKVLNLFLRDALYDQHLCEQYHLHEIEPHLELPLDGNVTKELRKRDKNGELPRRFKIKALTSNTSKRYQDFANKVANRGKYPCPRVHLDLLFWRREKQ